MLVRLIRCRKGATAIEYGLIMALIFVALVAGFRSTSSATVDLWGNLGNRVAAAR